MFVVYFPVAVMTFVEKGLGVEAEMLSQTGLIWSASSAVGVKMRIFGDQYTFLFDVFGDNSMR